MKLNTLLWIVAFPAALWAQYRPVSVSSPSWNGVEVQFVAKLEPSGNGGDRLPGSAIPTKDGAHRFITDAPNRRYFGYDLHLEPLEGSQTVRLRIQRLSLPLNPGWRLLAPPKYPEIPVVRVGQTVALDLLINPATGQKVVDYLSVLRSGFDTLRSSEAAHDFDLPDVELKLDHPHVWVNGKLAEATAQSSDSITAHVLWMYLAGSGSFVISLWPEPGLGFQKAGVVAANTLTFRDGSSDYRVECSSQIAPGPGLYYVYVSRDATCCTMTGSDRYAIGGADKAAYFIHKR